MNGLTLQKVEQMAMECLEKTGKHSPQIIVETPHGVVMVVLCFRNQDEKKKMHEQIRGLIQKSKVNNYFYVAEAWMSEQKKDNPAILPSRDIDRKEVLIVSEFRKDGFGESIMNEFERKGDSIIWKARNLQKSNEASSLLDFFSDRDAVRSKIDKGVFQHNKDYMDAFSRKLAKKYGRDFELCAETKDEVRFKEVMAKILGEMDDEMKRVNLRVLEDPEENQDDEN